MKKHTHLISLFLFIFLTLHIQHTHAESVKNISEYRDSYVRTNLSDLRVYAELYRDKESSYKGVCSSKDFKDMFGIIKKDLKGKIICNSSKETFVIEAKIRKEKGYYCADSTGAVVVNEKSQGKKAVSCTPLSKQKSNVTKDDHFISGTINSPVKVITYTDLECPYCKGFHATIKKLSSEYKDKVAFIYRHYPLTQIHPGAELAANATECASKLGGENSFKKYVDSVFEISPDFSSEKLSDLAGDIGINEKTFGSCLKNKKYSKEIQEDVKEGDKIANSTDMFGTPYSLVYGPKNKSTTIAGNQYYSQVKEILDGLLKK
jgi:protein-disulfide isomerase